VMAFSRTTIVTQEWTDDFAAASRGFRGVLEARIGLDTDINQAVWAAADYLHHAGGTSRRAILILTDNIQETLVPDALVDEQLAQAGAVLDGFLVRWPIPMPALTHPGILGFARNTGGEVIEGMHPAARLAEMIRRIKARYSIHFRPAETTSAQARRIHVELSEDARRRFPHARVRARRIYFPMGKYRPKTEIPAGHQIASTGRLMLRRGAEVAIVAGDFPVEQDIFHSGALADVVDQHVASAGGLAVYDDADVGHVAAEVPRD
jgi:hypothetical protein